MDETTEGKRLAAETVLAQGGPFRNARTGAVVPGVEPGTTFARDADYNLPNPSLHYGRADNPTYRHAEKIVCALESGADALLYPSGMAAIAGFFRSFSPGDHVVVQSRIYWGGLKWIRDFAAQYGLRLGEFDPQDPGSLDDALAGGAAGVWIESPGNPTWDLVDIAEAAGKARRAGAVLAVDNTVPTPLLTRPLELGADIVMHSATKYLNGHSDVLAGLLVTGNEDERWARIRAARQGDGAVPGSFDAWLLARGMRSLGARMRLHCENAMALAQWLGGQPWVERVLYPGLPDHPGHEIARRQMNGGFGGMLSILVKGGRDEALALAGGLKLIARATSLGGTESMIEHRATVEAGVTDIPENLLRVSVGLEQIDDLIADFEAAASGIANR